MVSNSTFSFDEPSAPAGPPQGPQETLGFGRTVLPRVEWASARPVLRPRAEARFLPLRRLGEGGLGEVVAAQDQDIGRMVAIKRVRTDRLSPGALVRFLQEIHTVGRLEHANIIPIHDVGRDADGALYFVMRLVDGETLESVIDRLRAGDPEAHRRYGFERRLGILRAVLEALEFAHGQGVIHRDIKPANVMIGRYGEVMLLDWGIARLVDRPDLPVEEGAAAPLLHTQAGALIGTPIYMSPEQARGEPVDARSDLYSFCVLAHELMTLEHYLGDLREVDAILDGVQRRAVPYANDARSPHQGPVPADIAWIIDDGVKKDPALRYPSARALLERLARRAEGEIPVQCPVTFVKRTTAAALHLFDRHTMAVMVAAGAGLLAVGGFGLLGLLSLFAVFG